MLAAFQNGDDIHTSVAAQIFHVSPEEVDADKRRVAKAVNFGVIYGQSPFGLAAALKIPQEEAAEFIEGYFNRFSRVDDYLFSILEDCSREGYVKTILGRKRAVSGVRLMRGKPRNLPERTAINTVIQGSAADLIKKAMLTCSTALKQADFPARMLLQIHDELVFETPKEHLEELDRLVKEAMETALELKVPLVVDQKSGPSWYETT